MGLQRRESLSLFGAGAVKTVVVSAFGKFDRVSKINSP